MEDVSGRLISLDIKETLWSRFFMISPLVVIGTREGDDFDLAPKNMAMPLGWDNYFAFVCTKRHSTYRNIRETGFFTASFPKPSQVELTSMTAEPRCGDEDKKPSLKTLPTIPARKIDGVLMKDAYLFFECKMDRMVDGFGKNSLIVGFIEAAHVDEMYLRRGDVSDGKLLHDAPLLAYLSPGRYAAITDSQAYPFPPGFRR